MQANHIASARTIVWLPRLSIYDFLVALVLILPPVFKFTHLVVHGMVFMF